MQVNRENLYGTQYLKTSDVKNGQKLTIEKVEYVASKFEKSGKKLGVFFKGFDLPLGLNATNFDYLVDKFGTDTDKWIGKTIAISIEPVKDFTSGKEVDGIRFA